MKQKLGRNCERCKKQGTFLNMFMEAKGRTDEFKKWNH